MNRVNRFICAVGLALFFAGAATADTLELKDGRVLKGKYLGGTQAMMRFELNGEVQTFNTTDIVALTFTGRSGSAGDPAVVPAAALASASSAPRPADCDPDRTRRARQAL